MGRLNFNFRDERLGILEDYIPFLWLQISGAFEDVDAKVRLYWIESPEFWPPTVIPGGLKYST